MSDRLGRAVPDVFGSGVTVTNSAVGGRSVRTWLYSVQTVMDATGECVLDLDASGNPILQSRWQAMLNATTGMKSGDYLFIQLASTTAIRPAIATWASTRSRPRTG